MPLFLEYSDKVKNRKHPIPKDLRLFAGALYNALDKIVPKNKLKNLKDLSTTKKYNRKGADSKNNGDNNNIKYISTDDAIKRLQRSDKNDITQGGVVVNNFLKRCVDKSTSMEKVSPVEPPKPTDNSVKLPKPKKDTIKVSNGTITINESYEYPKLYDYLDEYGSYYIFNSFLENPRGKQSWGVLINPEMYAKALREFTQYGRLVNFPTKYIYQWIGIIMKNTAILCSNTDIAGHSSSFPYEDFEDFLHSYFYDEREIDVDYNENIVKIEITPNEAQSICNGENVLVKENYLLDEYNDLLELIQDYNNSSYNDGKIEISKNNDKFYWVDDIFNFLDLIGLYDWMQMPDGSDAFSDYGLEPLAKILKEYNDELSAEKVLVLVNKALDVYHQRGDLASIFIQGGSKSLSRLAEHKKTANKKIYITEKQIVNLKHGKRC